jgi:adenylate kinase
MTQRTRPNILITGTPGTGKTTHAELVASATGFRHVNVGDLVKMHDLHSGWDERFEAYLLDEDKVRCTLSLRLAVVSCHDTWSFR